jgi:hypothetical protein
VDGFAPNLVSSLTVRTPENLSGVRYSATSMTIRITICQLLMALLGCATPAFALSIRYAFAGFGSGYLNGVNFQDASISIILEADPSARISTIQNGGTVS